MFVRYFLLLCMNCFIFVEAKPLRSVSQDLNIIFGCNSTSPVDKKTLNLALIEKRFESNIDDNFKCFLQCLYFNYNWMDDRGLFQLEEMRNTLIESSLDESSIEYLLITCTETEVDNKCERAFLFTECFWTESEKLERTLSTTTSNCTE